MLPELDASCVAFGHFGKDCGAGQCQTLPVPGPQLWLPLLGLAEHRKDQAVLQGRLLLVLGPGADRHMYQGTPQSASAFLVCWLPVRFIH